MADLDLERRGYSSLWWWLLGILVAVVVLGALWLALSDDGGAAGEPAASVPAEAGSQVTLIPVAAIVGAPLAYAGQTLEGEARVAEVPTDRGFWLEENGQRIFAILNDAPLEASRAVAAGQRVHVTQATVHTDPARVPGNLDPDTRRIATEQPAFLVIDQANVHLLAPGAGAAGTDTAGG